MSRLLDLGPSGLTYAAAGVSIDAGDDAVRRISATVASTNRPEVLGGIGGFGGLFHLDRERYYDPVLVASADGVGTKLEVARLVGRYDTVGLDLVAMLVDDLVCVGAEPLFLLDYVAVGSLDPARLEELVGGIAAGCRIAATALLGGETAEHGGVMRPDDLDVAGFAVGVVERGAQLGASRVESGDAIVGFASPGLRSNGYSLARRVLLGESGDPGEPGALDRPAYEGATTSLGEELLRPSVIYAPAALAALAAYPSAVHAIAHITGGGIVGNVVRVLPAHLDAVIDLDTFETPAIFFEIQRRGPVSADEMVRVFNCGLGMTVVVDPEVAADVVSIAKDLGVSASVVGRVEPGAGMVRLP